MTKKLEQLKAALAAISDIDIDEDDPAFMEEGDAQARADFIFWAERLMPTLLEAVSLLEDFTNLPESQYHYVLCNKARKVLGNLK